ncbi:O-antigen polymerase [Ferruginibacter sp. SUN002]|uniref:O-antigen polymerase n=1 Tax=Ferruginibacter sp. SUN002 TaxID=2937789 RepID=UPI003D36A1FD
MFRLRHLFFLPSFYLLVTFTIAYVFYLSDVINWEQPPVELHYWSIITVLSALLSSLVHSKKVNTIINENTFRNNISTPFLTDNTRKLFLAGILIIGLLGVAKYVLDYSKFLGAFGVFYSIFMEDTGQLRTLAENVESVGTQLSYFSWLAAFIITVDVAAKNISKKYLFLVFFIILLNSIFLDRTRPIWIIFTCALCYFITTYQLYSRKKIVYFISGMIASFVGLFILIGSLLGKGSSDESYTKFNLPKEVQPFFLYLTSSFAYLGRLFYYDAPNDYLPVRIAYPVTKLMSKFGLAEKPPNPILEFFTVPLLTNVGTFLEPFYQDGGRLFLAFGIILHTFLFDKIAMYFMNRISPASIIAISTLCFINFIAFFVPKVTTPAVWLILAFCFILTKIDFPKTVKATT